MQNDKESNTKYWNLIIAEDCDASTCSAMGSLDFNGINLKFAATESSLTIDSTTTTNICTADNTLVTVINRITIYGSIFEDPLRAEINLCSINEFPYKYIFS